MPNRDTPKTLEYDEVGVLEPVNYEEIDHEKEFIQDVASALDGEPTTVYALANQLISEFPLFAAESETSLRRKIMEVFSKPKKIGNSTIQYQVREDRQKGKHWIQVTEK